MPLSTICTAIFTTCFFGTVWTWNQYVFHTYIFVKREASYGVKIALTWITLPLNFCEQVHEPGGGRSNPVIGRTSSYSNKIRAVFFPEKLRKNAPIDSMKPRLNLF